MAKKQATVKVKLLVSRSGPAGAQNRGDTIDVPTDEATRMAAAGQCELLRQPRKAETTVAPDTSEKATGAPSQEAVNEPEPEQTADTAPASNDEAGAETE